MIAFHVAASHSSHRQGRCPQNMLRFEESAVAMDLHLTLFRASRSRCFHCSKRAYRKCTGCWWRPSRCSYCRQWYDSCARLQYVSLIYPSGLSSIEVSDNGSGICPDDYEVLAVKHTTSKIAVFSDLEKVQSFGFRGEALSSLCAIGDGITVTTRTAAQTVATKLVYDRNGVLVSRSPCARKQGTTVIVTKLFSSLPVRLKDFELNKSRELHRTNKRVQVSSRFRFNNSLIFNCRTSHCIAGLRTCLHEREIQRCQCRWRTHQHHSHHSRVLQTPRQLLHHIFCQTS